MSEMETNDVVVPSPPKDLYEFAVTFAPVLKYYAVLLVLYFIAKRVNRMLEEEANKAQAMKVRLLFHRCQKHLLRKIV